MAKTKKIASLLLIVVLLASVVVGCSPQAETPDNGNGERPVSERKDSYSNLWRYQWWNVLSFSMPCAALK